MSRNHGHPDFDELRKRDVMNYRDHVAEASFEAISPERIKATPGIRRAICSLNEKLEYFFDADNDPAVRAKLERWRSSINKDFERLLRELRKVAPVPTKVVLKRISAGIDDVFMVVTGKSGNPESVGLNCFFKERWHFLVWELGEEIERVWWRQKKMQAPGLKIRAGRVACLLPESSYRPRRAPDDAPALKTKAAHV